MQAQDARKLAVARAALAYIPAGEVIGVGTGSTANFFIDLLKSERVDIAGAVASSQASAARLHAHGFDVLELNDVDALSVYVDGADEFDPRLCLIKGGGAALTREKIVAAASRRFVCIVDDSKRVDVLGQFPLPIEVLAMARSYVARELVKLGGHPIYREGVVTDNGHQILDVWGLHISDPVTLEARLNQIDGIVCNGLFAQRPADVVLMADATGVHTLLRPDQRAASSSALAPSLP